MSEQQHASVASQHGPGRDARTSRPCTHAGRRRRGVTRPPRRRARRQDHHVRQHRHVSQLLLARSYHAHLTPVHTAACDLTTREPSTG